ncbi:MAG: carboxymuconolactone decarboxylase family protein [Rhodospirillales bacterium]|nr:carboxymuconolactone decarboxylase family protein [Rhodospirillales bacterium]
MAQSYPDLAKELNGDIKNLRDAIPETMAGFSAMGNAAKADGAMDPKAKELVAIGIAIATRCDGCITFHVKAAIHHGATREEISETIAMAVYMGGGPSMIYGSLTLKAFDQYSG